MIKQAPTVLTPGLPDGLSFSTLDELCLEHQDRPLQRASYQTLEVDRQPLAWKETASYRVLLTLSGSKTWNLIFRNITYHSERVPAISELGNTPGSTEYVVYTKASGTLARFLPQPILCTEVTPGKHYKYLLEDLSSEFQAIQTPQSAVMVVAEMTNFHRTLSLWAKALPGNKLLSYDRNFSAVLRDQAEKTFERFSRRSVNSTINEVTKLWTRIAKVHNNPEFYGYQTLRPIHGDFNRNNILRRSSPQEVKILNWEWVGLGVPHMDLVVLLQKATPEQEIQALSTYARQDKQLTLEEHTRLYQWCKLDRMMFLTTYLANQQMDSTSKRFITMPKTMEEMLQQLLDSYRSIN